MMKQHNKYDVLVVGELNVDLILYNVNKPIEIGKEIFSEDMVLTLGSSSAILANNLSILGANVSFFGMLGNDVFAEIVLKSLKKSNVSTENIIISDEDKTGATIAMSYGNDRAMVTFPGAMSVMKQEDISDEVLMQAKHLHVSSIFMQKSLLKGITTLFKRAKNLGLTTSLDTQWDPDEKWNISTKELLPYVDVFLPNKEEFLRITKKETIDKAYQSVKKYANIVIVKDSVNGVHAFAPEKQFYQPAFIMENIVDAIGAGDSFNAGFLKEYINKNDLETCVLEGTIAGAINTQGEGGTGAFKDIEKISLLRNELLNRQL